MNLDSLANLGDFVAGIGVIASLLYLASQVRQNTAQIRAGTTQAFTDTAVGLLSSIYIDPDTSAIAERGLGPPIP